MSLIERAGKQLGLQPEKSKIEKAVDTLGTADRGAVSAAAAQRQSYAPRDDRRETRRQITIDFDRVRAMGLALPQDQSPLAEEFRLIKRPLVNAAHAADVHTPMENRNLIMVTSAGASEGKTFVAINLAFSIASEHDTHVLLIDADLTRPTIPSVLGFEALPGLIDAVSDDTVDLADVMIRTNIENLSVLPAGLFRPGASELLASGRMARFIDEIARRYSDRIIIFDSPPVLARSEPIVLAKHVGQIVFVVEAERTSRTALDEALRLIGHERVAGIVLNKAPAISMQDRFGHHYGYYGR